MASVITIAIPDELQARIIAFCRDRQQIPPELNITLVEPSLLGKMTGLEQKLQSFCLGQGDFNMVVGGPSVFTDQMLYLNVLPGVISLVRGKLLDYLKIKPSRDKVYHPHLTIVRAQPGRAINAPKLLADAQAVFGTPYPVTVGGVELYTRPSDSVPYKHQASMRFTGR
jgi:2'-5' RNA ligase